MGIADKQTDPANPPGCLLVQGGIACGTGSESVPFELAARRAQNEDQLRDRFVRAKAEGDLKPTSDPAALARYVSAVSVGMGVMASSGSDREALRQVASVAVQAVEAQSTARTCRAVVVFAFIISPIAWQTAPAAGRSRRTAFDQPGERNRCAVLEIRSDDLDADRQARWRALDRNGRCRQSAGRSGVCPDEARIGIGVSCPSISSCRASNGSDWSCGKAGTAAAG